MRAGKLPQPRRIYIALGLGGSATGLVIGCALLGFETEMVAVRASNTTTVTRSSLRTLHFAANEAIERAHAEFAQADVLAMFLEKLKCLDVANSVCDACGMGLCSPCHDKIELLGMALRIEGEDYRAADDVPLYHAVRHRTRPTMLKSVPTCFVIAAILASTSCSNKPAPAADAASNSTAAIDAPSAAQAVIQQYAKELSDAGDLGQCDAAVERVRKAMALDRRLADQDLQGEIDHFDKVKGPMPYPSPGTSCAIFGMQRALHGALSDRRSR